MATKFTIRKKSSRFWDFPYIFLNKSGLTGPISRNSLWRPHPTRQNVRNMVFLYPHGTLGVTIIVISAPPPQNFDGNKTSRYRCTRIYPISSV